MMLPVSIIYQICFVDFLQVYLIDHALTYHVKIRHEIIDCKVRYLSDERGR